MSRIIGLALGAVSERTYPPKCNLYRRVYLGVFSFCSLPLSVIRGQAARRTGPLEVVCRSTPSTGGTMNLGPR